jgi:hypothetical protein
MDSDYGRVDEAHARRGTDDVAPNESPAGVSWSAHFAQARYIHHAY